MSSDNSTGISAMGGLALVIVFVLASCAACGYGASVDSTGVKVGRPQDFAAATGVARAADLALTATAQALDYHATAAAVQMQATSTAIAGAAQATATAQAQIANATATAVPWQAAQVANEAQTSIVNKWTGVAALVGGVAVTFLVGLAAVAFIRTRAKIVPRDASGQLPGVLIGGTLTDPQRQIGPAVTMPKEPGLLWNVARIVRYIRTGAVLPLPTPQVQLTDGGATADHYLEAARQASQVATAAAIFQPGDPKARKEKIELLVKKDSGRLLGGSRMPEVKLIDDPQKVKEFQQVLELESGE